MEELRELGVRSVPVVARGQRCIAQLPAARLDERAIEGRDRSIRDLAYHVYQIPDAFLRAVIDGHPDLAALCSAPAPAGVQTTADVCAYGSRISKRLADWWSTQADKSCGGTLDAYYGEQPLHHVLERVGIAPERPPTAEDYAGLPMPERLWE